MLDALQGMVYVHKSVLLSHGALTSANCHVDSRWVLDGLPLHKSVLQSHGALTSANCHVDSRWVLNGLPLHKSVLQSHGALTSANCHVDSRWVLKVSGFGLHAFTSDVNKEVRLNDLCLHFNHFCWRRV